jgi:hypothetical protein
MHKAFEVHRLNEGGMAKAQELAEAFDKLLAQAQYITGTPRSVDPAARERALMITHLELAGFYAKKTMAQLSENQADEPGSDVTVVPSPRPLLTYEQAEKGIKR